ncbi:MAG: NUDIX domain-containing protein [Verrucomicrobiae bacterium]|nr:NUDIX domain-containing protein [Verrucomicrobiae bacterium]
MPQILPHRVTTLLIAFNPRDEVLLLERTREPNRGLWSPPGGKVHTEEGESPYECAVREAREEMGLELSVRDLHLAGLVAEKGYEGKKHWLMFVFEIRPLLQTLPLEHPEGRFEFFSRARIESGDISIPQTDREKIWPSFWKYRGGFFSLSCECLEEGSHRWVEEETISGRAIGPA